MEPGKMSIPFTSRLTTHKRVQCVDLLPRLGTKPNSVAIRESRGDPTLCSDEEVNPFTTGTLFWLFLEKEPYLFYVTFLTSLFYNPRAEYY